MSDVIKRFLLSGFLLIVASTATSQTIETEKQLSDLYDLVYQIVVIETETNNKSALGSGFQISEDGLVITNYHVISNFVFEPDHHRVEFVAQNGDKGSLELLSFDVINDLAILKREQPPSAFFALAQTAPSRGDNIYALGNPRDIGMLMVSGAYNGLAQSSYTDQILFSGSLNPGMSGGPTVNEKGEVTGVNVSTAGSQLSFLVPVSKVFALREKAITPLTTNQYHTTISQQIREFQTLYFSQLLSSEWTLEDLGDYAKVPGEMGLDTNCWGNSNEENDEALILSLRLQCNNSNSIYLQPGLNTGILHYSYTVDITKSALPFQFHKLVGNMTYYPDNSATVKEVSPYKCEQSYLEDEASTEVESFVQIGFCSRAYINLDNMYDIAFYRTRADNTHSMTSHFTLAGVDKSVALQFTQRFMEAVKWTSF